MTMTPPLRKLALTAHVASSVGWLGSVAAFLALAIAGVTRGDAPTVRGAYVAMDLITWSVIVPLSLASLVTGLIQSLGTPWGLLRHYWVAFKLLLTVVATGVLLLHTRPIQVVASAAAEAALAGGDLRRLRIQLVADAAAALAVLLVATALSVYKPRGVTPHGRREVQRPRAALAP
ncbi:hypothetical protein [Sorangium sp. So ce406]|uniref:hypothetical protein n=1 Tax=Sorangium sp. So ce406 TaxID=3133311 RepID=UPI003F5AFCD6